MHAEPDRNQSIFRFTSYVVSMFFLFFWSALICFKAATDKTCPPQRTAQLQLDKLGIIVRSLRSLGPARPRARELPWRA